jgi:hypothetical protein
MRQVANVNFGIPTGGCRPSQGNCQATYRKGAARTSFFSPDLRRVFVAARGQDSEPAALRVYSVRQLPPLACARTNRERDTDDQTSRLRTTTSEPEMDATRSARLFAYGRLSVVLVL